MKTRYLLLLILPFLFPFAATAQSFAINTDGSIANTSAILDVKSTVKGLLIPRMTRTERNAIVSPATGLLIFQNGPDSIGLYYYNGSRWSWMFTAANADSLAWKTGGNTGTTSANFIGTTDNKPLRLKVNNTPAGYIDYTSGNLSLGLNALASPSPTSNSNIAIGLASMNSANAGTSNIGIGAVTLYNNVGDYNTAIGDYALADNFTGDYNTGIGTRALTHNNSGLYNTSVGEQSLGSNYAGSYNTAIGKSSLASNITGSRNTALGDSADVLSSNLVNATAIGSNAAVNCSNCLVLGSINGINGASSNVNVGVGTTTPQALLNVKRGAVLFDSTIGTTPVSGAGTRLMWIPAKASFRAGIVTANEWDDSNIGLNSFASGYGTTASGPYSIAMGSLATATANFSIAIGNGTTASGQYCNAIGNGATANGDQCTALGAATTASNFGSMAMGHVTTASGAVSTAMGGSTIANGSYSTAMGNLTRASGGVSTAMGGNTTASGGYSTAMGFNTKSKSYAGFVTGLYNDSTNAADPLNYNLLNRIFQIGNGSTDFARSNAMTVLQNGNTGIGTVNPATKLHVAGAESTLNGENAAIRISNTNSTNNWILRAGATGTATPVDGFTIADNNAYRLAINSSGNVGIGTTAPAALLDVNGTTTTNGLQVSNGTVITKMQSGSVNVGSSASGQLVYTLNFPVTFATATPRVFATARNQSATSFSDSFSVSVRSISATSVVLNIQRTDTNAAWAQNLIIDWFAVE